MDKEHLALFELIKIGISGKVNSEVQLLTDKGTDWEQIFKISCIHGVICLAFNGIETLYANGINPCPVKVKLNWYLQAKNQCQTYEKKKSLCIEYVNRLNLPCVVLKGLDYCKYWPKPEWRNFGDLDIWTCGRYQEGNERSKEIGCKVHDEGYYKHSEIIYKKLVVENHEYLTMFDGTKSGRYIEQSLRQLLKEPFNNIEGSTILSPNETFTAVFMLVHAHQHFFYEGFSLKFILDWYFFLKRNENDGNVDWEKVLNIFDKAGIRGFYDVMTAFCCKYFDMTPALANSRDSKLLEEFSLAIFDENYGQKESKTKQLMKRFHRMWRFRHFLGESVPKRITNTFIYNYWHHKPKL